MRVLTLEHQAALDAAAALFPIVDLNDAFRDKLVVLRSALDRAGQEAPWPLAPPPRDTSPAKEIACGPRLAATLH
jgi:hypothetical protein